VAAAELELLDYKRRVHALYARVRAEPDPARAFASWVAERDALFAHHPQSALAPERPPGFTGLSSFPHDPPPNRLAIAVRMGERRFAWSRITAVRTRSFELWEPEERCGWRA
jgi:hypothetical protein